MGDFRVIISEFGEKDNVDSEKIGEQQQTGVTITELKGWDPTGDAPPPESGPAPEIRVPGSEKTAEEEAPMIASVIEDETIEEEEGEENPQDVAGGDSEMIQADEPEPQPQAPEVEKVAAANIFASPSAGPRELMLEMTNRYGIKWIDWEPETIFSSIKEDTGEYAAPVNNNKIMAIKVMMRSDQPWTSWNVFEKVAVAFNNRVPNFGFTEYLSPLEIANAVSLMNDIREMEWGDEVRVYVAAITRDHGFSYLPEPLNFAQDMLDHMGNDTALRDAIKSKLELVDIDDLNGFMVDEDDPVDLGVARSVVILRESK